MIKFDVDYKSGTHKVYDTKFDYQSRRFITTGFRDEPIKFFVITTKEEVNKAILDQLADEVFSDIRMLLVDEDKIMVVIDAANLDGHFIVKQDDTIDAVKKGFKREYVSKVEIATMMNGKPEKGPKK